jgi:hypothetical protein
MIIAISTVLPDIVTNPLLYKIGAEEAKIILKGVNLLIDHSIDETVLSMIVIVRCMLENFPEYRNLITESEIIDKIILLLIHENQQIKLDSIQLLSGILINYINERSTILNVELFNDEIYTSLKEFLKSYNFNLKGGALIVLAKISFKNESNIQLLIKANLIPILSEIINNGRYNIRMLVIKIILNIVEVCNEKQISYIHSKNIVHSLSNSFIKFVDETIFYDVSYIICNLQKVC